jgi:asparagine synthetase B (glutamine-hydrolysing)
MLALRVGHAHGGDGRSLQHSDTFAAGHRLLNITAEDASESQPQVSADGRFWLVADAHIDNRVVLGECFGVPRADLSSLPDSALILKALQRWETDCVKHLLGSFAFAIRDSWGSGCSWHVTRPVSGRCTTGLPMKRSHSQPRRAPS